MNTSSLSSPSVGGIRLPPYRTRQRAGGVDQELEFRMASTLTNPTYTSAVHPVVALTKGSWDSEAIKTDYLSKQKWKLIIIPEMVAKAQAAALKSLDLNDHEAVTKHFNLTN